MVAIMAVDPGASSNSCKSNPKIGLPCVQYDRNAVCGLRSAIAMPGLTSCSIRRIAALRPI